MPTADDDLRWVPIEAAHQRRTEQTGNAHLAAADLMQEMIQGNLHCMARSLRGGRRLVAPTEWVDQIKLDTAPDGVRVIYHEPLYQTKGQSIANPVRGACYYVWQPEVEAIWPAWPPNDDGEAPDTPPKKRGQQPTPPRKTGRPPALTQKEIDKAKALVRRADREHRRDHPGQKLKISSALTLLQQTMKRGGKPIKVSPNTWKNHVIRPALSPDRTNNN